MRLLNRPERPRSFDEEKAICVQGLVRGYRVSQSRMLPYETAIHVRPHG
jgi:hypothetical protein